MTFPMNYNLTMNADPAKLYSEEIGADYIAVIKNPRYTEAPEYINQETRQQFLYNNGLDNGNKATVFSFTFSDEEMKSLAEECGFLICQLIHLRGIEIKDGEISPAITMAAEKAGKISDDLNIITAITWKKRKED